MQDTPATSHARAHLLGIAALAQQSLDLDDPASFWYRQGARDAHAYATALLVTGQPGQATQAIADRVIQLLGEGVTDVGALMEATDVARRPVSGPRHHLAVVEAQPESPGVQL